MKFKKATFIAIALSAVSALAVTAAPKANCTALNARCGECTYDTPWRSGISGVLDGGRCVRCSNNLPGQ